jgi:hypothetical protein
MGRPIISVQWTQAVDALSRTVEHPTEACLTHGEAKSGTKAFDKVAHAKLGSPLKWQKGDPLQVSSRYFGEHASRRILGVDPNQLTRPWVGE